MVNINMLNHYPGWIYKRTR